MSQTFASFEEFYPFYLSEHSDQTCRRLHFIGTTVGLLLFAAAIITQNYWLFLLGFVQGYAWAWVGHFYFEHNKPATFKYPFYSFIGDWYMYRDMLTGKIKW